jgi:amino acid permease
MIIYGTRLYGKTDHVPGLFFICTSFAHLNFIPLIPLGSYLIFDDGTESNGVSCPFHFTSFLLAWARAAGVVLALVLVAMALFASRSEVEIRIGQFVVAFVAAVLVFISYRIIRCGRQRAATLAERAGLDPNLVHDHFDRLEGKPQAERPAAGPLDNDQLQDALRRWNPK